MSRAKGALHRNLALSWDKRRKLLPDMCHISHQQELRCSRMYLQDQRH